MEARVNISVLGQDKLNVISRSPHLITPTKHYIGYSKDTNERTASKIIESRSWLADVIAR